MEYSIYALKNQKTNTVFYVGCTTQPLKIRLSGHKSSAKHSNSLVYRYMRKVRIVPTIELIETVEASSEQKANIRESYWVDQMRQRGFTLYNCDYNVTISSVQNKKIKFFIVSEPKKRFTTFKERTGFDLNDMESMNKFFLDYDKIGLNKIMKKFSYRH